MTGQVASNSAADQQRLEAAVGHPAEKFQQLQDRIQSEVLGSFREIETDFLDLIWALDAYRVAQVVPRGMGKAGKAGRSPSRQLEGVYRGKGNYLPTALALVLGNKTTSRLAPRTDVQGFSQTHQIDVAWPARDSVPLMDPHICAEVKLTGAPGYPGNEEGRGAMSDWSNRRKELKFQATDLKLYRHVKQRSEIEHWDLWRRQALPFVYSLWAARLRPTDDVERMIAEAQILTNTYCDGVGIYAFSENKTGDGYTPAQLSKGVSARVTSLDSVLEEIAARIRSILEKNQGHVPPAVQ